MKLQLSTLLIGFLAIPALTYGSSEVKEEVQQRFFLKSYQTTTITTLSVVVTTVPYFCAVTSGTDSCTGRRLRRRRRINLPQLGDGETLMLEKSTDDLEYDDVPSEREDERLFFTLWQSTTTTVTVTTTSTNRSITISASAYCTFANFNIPLC